MDQWAHISIMVPIIYNLLHVPVIELIMAVFQTRCGNRALEGRKVPHKSNPGIAELKNIQAGSPFSR